MKGKDSAMDKATILDGITEGQKYLIYDGRPLVRENNVIVYGCVEEKYILKITIMTNKEVDGKQVPDKMIVQVVNTDESLPMNDRIAKQDMISGLYDAFDLGIAWLKRHLAS